MGDVDLMLQDSVIAAVVTEVFLRRHGLTATRTGERDNSKIVQVGIDVRRRVGGWLRWRKGVWQRRRSRGLLFDYQIGEELVSLVLHFVARVAGIEFAGRPNGLLSFRGSLTLAPQIIT